VRSLLTVCAAERSGGTSCGGGINRVVQVVRLHEEHIFVDAASVKVCFDVEDEAVG
jgi:hypothetical protein